MANGATMNNSMLIPIICCIFIPALYLLISSICLAASLTDDVNENAAIIKAREDEVDDKIGRAVRGETKWKRRMEDDND